MPVKKWEETITSSYLLTLLASIILLHISENTIQNATFRPTIDARINRMPIVISLRQTTPFASMLCYVNNRV